MPRSQPYPPAFRDQILDLLRSGRSIASLAREFEPCEQTIRNWKKQADIDAGHRPGGPTTSADEEIAELRRRLRRVEQERDILAKATAWFAQETIETPTDSSRS
jgi:transposase